MLKKQQKELFLIIIRKFVEVINEDSVAGVKSETGTDHESLQGPFWLKWVGERFEDFLLMVCI